MTLERRAAMATLLAGRGDAFALLLTCSDGVAAAAVPPIANNSAISEMTVAADRRCKNRRPTRASLLTVAC